ncbi:hypothetical protein NUW54_g2461 [Trametes sanguinea]|uniref:Uncharacterized protein n=2 Tax=Trametes sanguinea TaxID=158606 RepID=A0ACC1PYS7_9APHY|nr:hypothetical protein NUW54_g4342 [Trametes sanguinea]KAJ3010503.1 hypothetical protein NUW54_g2461 [Trametes sanguinea]
MNSFWLYRVFTLVLVTVFSIVVLGLCAHASMYLNELLHIGVGVAGGRSYHCAVLGLVAAIITFLSTVPMLLSAVFLETSFTSYVIFDIYWLSILYMLWVSVGSVTLDDGSVLYLGRGNCFDYTEHLPQMVRVECSVTHAIAAFEFAIFGFLFIYVVALVAVAFQYRAKMHASPWTRSVRDLVR